MDELQRSSTLASLNKCHAASLSALPSFSLSFLRSSAPQLYQFTFVQRPCISKTYTRLGSQKPLVAFSRYIPKRTKNFKKFLEHHRNCKQGGTRTSMGCSGDSTCSPRFFFSGFSCIYMFASIHETDTL